MMIERLVLAAILSLAVAAPALASSSAGLAIGGNTIAGPGATTLAPDIGATLYTNPAADTDVCTTVVNTGRGLVRLTLTGGGAGTIDINPGRSAALCRNDVTSIGIDCLGVAPNSCAAQWRVDRD